MFGADITRLPPTLPIVDQILKVLNFVSTPSHPLNTYIPHPSNFSICIDCLKVSQKIVTINRAWNRSASFRLTQWLKIISHINEPVIFSHLKLLHTIDKVSLNASILYRNQEICNKTNLWKFQLILLFILRENSKNAFSIFVFILMAGVFVSRDENSLWDLISLIIRKR